MDHDELRDLIPIYVLSALPADEATEIEVHLRSCCECCWDALRFSQAALMAIRDGGLRKS